MRCWAWRFGALAFDWGLGAGADFWGGFCLKMGVCTYMGEGVFVVVWGISPWPRTRLTFDSEGGRREIYLAFDSTHFGLDSGVGVRVARMCRMRAREHAHCGMNLNGSASDSCLDISTDINLQPIQRGKHHRDGSVQPCPPFPVSKRSSHQSRNAKHR